MPPRGLSKRKLQETRQLSATLINESKAALDRARAVIHQVRNDAQLRANRRALDRAARSNSKS